MSEILYKNVVNSTAHRSFSRATLYKCSEICLILYYIYTIVIACVGKPSLPPTGCYVIKILVLLIDNQSIYSYYDTNLFP